MTSVLVFVSALVAARILRQRPPERHRPPEALTPISPEQMFGDPGAGSTALPSAALVRFDPAVSPATSADGATGGSIPRIRTLDPLEGVFR